MSYEFRTLKNRDHLTGVITSSGTFLLFVVRFFALRAKK
jgi:hypothetical protein